MSLRDELQAEISTVLEGYLPIPGHPWFTPWSNKIVSVVVNWLVANAGRIAAADLDGQPVPDPVTEAQVRTVALALSDWTS